MIGIITPYKIANYGTKLQAYAMQQLMNKYDDAELIGFVSATDRRITSVIGKIYLKIIRKLQRRKALPITEEMKLRTKSINMFDVYYRFGTQVKGNSNLRKELKRYDAVVCGSDQLWAPQNVIADYFTMTIIPREINKFSYAASFGVNEIPNYLRGKYRKYLTRLNCISVREEQGAKIVNDIAQREARVVLDPTLMLEHEEWATLASNSKLNLNYPYVFCYFLGTTSEHREFAKKLAEEKGMKLVTIPHFKEWNAADEGFGDIPIYEAGPVEFLSLIKNASYVCTDSFHGTVFSIIFHRQVAVFERFKKEATESTNSRIYSLLNNLGLDEQLFQNANDTEKFSLNSIDYERVYERLENLKTESFMYLDKAINMNGVGDSDRDKRKETM